LYRAAVSALFSLVVLLIMHCKLHVVRFTFEQIKKEGTSKLINAAVVDLLCTQHRRRIMLTKSTSRKIRSRLIKGRIEAPINK